MAIPQVLANNLSNSIAESFGSYEVVAELLSEEDIRYILTFPGDTIVIKSWNYLMDLSNFDKLINAPYRVLDKDLNLLYTVSGQQVFGRDERDLETILDTPHGHYLHLSFRSVVGDKLILLWICREVRNETKRKFISQWTQNREQFIETNITNGEIFLTNDLGGTLRVYFMPGEYRGDIEIGDVITNQASQLLLSSEERLVNVFPKYNGWYAFIIVDAENDQVFPARITNITGFGRHKLRYKNALHHISIDQSPIETFNLNYDDSSEYITQNLLSINGELSNGTQFIGESVTISDEEDLTLGYLVGQSAQVIERIKIDDEEVITSTSTIIQIIAQPTAVTVDDTITIDTTNTVPVPEFDLGTLTNIDGGTFDVIDESFIIFRSRITEQSLNIVFLDDPVTMTDEVVIGTTHIIEASLATTPIDGGNIDVIDTISITTAATTDTNFWNEVPFLQFLEDEMSIDVTHTIATPTFTYISQAASSDVIESIDTTGFNIDAAPTNYVVVSYTVDDSANLNLVSEIEEAADIISDYIVENIFVEDPASIIANHSVTVDSTTTISRAETITPSALVINITHVLVNRNAFTTNNERVQEIEDTVEVNFAAQAETNIWTTVTNTLNSFDDVFVGITHITDTLTDPPYERRTPTTIISEGSVEVDVTHVARKLPYVFTPYGRLEINDFPIISVRPVKRRSDIIIYVPLSINLVDDISIQPFHKITPYDPKKVDPSIVSKDVPTFRIKWRTILGYEGIYQLNDTVDITTTSAVGDQVLETAVVQPAFFDISANPTIRLAEPATGTVDDTFTISTTESIIDSSPATVSLTDEVTIRVMPITIKCYIPPQVTVNDEFTIDITPTTIPYDEAVVDMVFRVKETVEPEICAVDYILDAREYFSYNIQSNAVTDAMSITITNLIVELAMETYGLTDTVLIELLDYQITT